MAKILLSLPSFTAGELSPRMEGRTDFQKYYSSGTILENFVVEPHGPITRRPGTYFVTEVKDSTKKTRLIPFTFSTAQAYILEFGNQYIRFYKNQGQILSGASAYEIATPYLETELFDIKFAQSADVMYLCHKNYPTKKLSRTGHTAWTLTNVDFTYGPFMPINIEDTKLSCSAIIGSAITITADSIIGINNGTGFQTTDIGRLIKIGDSEGYAKITARASTTSITAEVLEPLSTTTPGELKKNCSTSDTTIYAVSVTNFPTAGTILIENEQITYTGLDTTANTFTGCTRAAYSTTAAVHNAANKIYLSTIVPTTNWSLGYFNSVNGYPTTVTFFEQRLVFGGSLSYPQTIWFSKSGSYENFSSGTKDDSAMVYTIASNQVNAITALKATRTLIVATTGGEFTVSSGANQDAVTPTNLNIRKQSSFGSSQASDAISIGAATLFVQRAKRKIRELAYNFSTDGYLAPDLTILAEHVTSSGVVQMEYQQEPYGILWCIRTDGVLIGMTYDRAQDIVAWHRHYFGGLFQGGHAVCESIAVIDGTQNEDEVWVIVKRTINGVTKRYIEYLTPYNFNSDLNTFHFLDAGLHYSGSATSRLSGLTHLEGQTVSVIVNGATHPDCVVRSGAITLLRSTTDARVGLNYTSTLQTMRLDEGFKGTDQTKTKRIFDVTLRFLETVGAKVGPNVDSLDDIPFRDSSAPMNEAVPLFSGDKKIQFADDYGKDSYVRVEQQQALPMTILAIYPRLEIWND
jgi:hypothetical protein